MQVQHFQFSDLSEALAQLQAQPKAKADQHYLIQVFATISPSEAQQLADALKAHYPNSAVLGMSCHNAIHQGEHYEGKLVLSVLALRETRLTSALRPLTADSCGTTLAGMLQDTQRDDSKVAICFAHGINAAQQELFGELSEDFKLPIVGGIIDHSAESQGPWLMLDQQVTHDSLALVVLHSNSLRVWQRAFLEWEPIGREMVINKVDGHRLYQLDGKSVLEAYNRYFSVDGECQFEVCQDFPIYCRGEQGNITYSAPIKLYDDGSMQMTEPLPEGAKVQFSYFHPNLTRSRIQQKLLQQHQEELPEVAFMYNCASRIFNSDGAIEEELEVFEQLAPSVGAYCYGEFAADGGQRIAHHSVTYLGLAEQVRVRQAKSAQQLENRPVDRSLSPLFSLINQAFDDLAQLNVSLENKVETKSRELLSSLQQHNLTQLPNRSQLMPRLSPYQHLQAMVVIKLCNLGWINHGAGDLFGDQAVIWTAKQLQAYCTQHWPEHQLLQLSSSEWLLAVCEAQPQPQLRRQLISMVEGIERQACPLVREGEQSHTYVVLKAGVVERADGLMPTSEIEINRLLHRAKQARRDALSGNTVVAFYNKSSHDIQDPSQAMGAIETVKQALANDQVEIFGQAIFSRGSRDLASVECLVRIRQGEGYLSPGVFLPAISQTNLYSELSRAIIRKSIEGLDGKGIRYSINLAPQDFFNEETYACLVSCLNHAKTPELFSIEVLESEQIRDYERFANRLSSLRKLGVTVIIDDFGSGYSNLYEILKLQPDIVKLDGSLVRDIDSDPQQRLMVEHLNNLCQAMQIRTTAEFVRNQAICEIVEGIGIDYLQGFYLAEPQAIKQLLANKA